MEFVEVIKQFNRICNSHAECAGCPISEQMHSFCLDDCKFNLLEEAVKMEAVITEWAAEHPEPKYPSWWQYLADIGVLPHELTPAQIDPVDGLLKQIPDETAIKLGIKPKEG